MIRDRAKSSRIALETGSQDSLPRVLADERMVKQILINILSNAVKFTPEGGRVVVSAEIDPEDGGLTIAVSDTGIGIAESHMEKGDGAVRQADGALNRKFDGGGLGLPLARALAELHCGTLDLESEVGQGTTVTGKLSPERLVA